MVSLGNNIYDFTVDEYNALQHITRINKMDCWFSIRTRYDDTFYIFDLEENKRISIREALKDIYQGLLYEDFYELSYEEQQALKGLFKKYKMEV